MRRRSRVQRARGRRTAGRRSRTRAGPASPRRSTHPRKDHRRGTCTGSRRGRRPSYSLPSPVGSLGSASDARVIPSDQVAAFGDAVVATLSATLEGALVGGWFVGSVALGGYVDGESDVDIVAVCADAVDDATKALVVEGIL